jgi:NADPH-dependent 2,4-dienoyl-CoA reductase/sulfur reductase-like enzyme
METHYRYLIIGGGMTGDAAARGIRKIDTEGTIGLLSAESDPPYNRPPLTKGLWKGRPLERIFRKTDTLNVSLHLGCTAQTLDPKNRWVTDSKGNVFTYEKLLLATGGFPRRLPFGGNDIVYYRYLDDYKQLRPLAEQGKRILVIGGGFIGSEIAASLNIVGGQVVMAFPEANIGAFNFPPEVAAFISDYYRQRGIEVLNGVSVTGVEKVDGKLRVALSNGSVLTVDSVVAGIGIQPDVSLAESAGLRIENGIVVGENLRTTVPDIFAAGDVATFYNPVLGRRMRVEHEDNANTMGELAGRGMAGENVTYHHLPGFYSDLFDIGYEAVGEMDSRLEMFADWQEPFKKGVIYYLKDGRVRGVVLWDIWKKQDEARALISEKGPFTERDLQGHISG